MKTIIRYFAYGLAFLMGMNSFLLAQNSQIQLKRSSNNKKDSMVSSKSSRVEKSSPFYRPSRSEKSSRFYKSSPFYKPSPSLTPYYHRQPHRLSRGSIRYFSQRPPLRYFPQYSQTNYPSSCDPRTGQTYRSYRSYRSYPSCSGGSSYSTSTYYYPTPAQTYYYNYDDVPSSGGYYADSEYFSEEEDYHYSDSDEETGATPDYGYSSSEGSNERYSESNDSTLEETEPPYQDTYQEGTYQDTPPPPVVKEEQMKQSSTFRRTPPPSRSPASLLEEDLIRGEPTQSESSHPSSFFTKMNEGKRLFKQGAYEEAGQAFLQASFLDRYAYAAHWGVALSFFARERYSSTASSFRTGFQQITNPFAVRENFISYYGYPRNFETHLTRLKGYLARYPYDLETQFVLALLYFYTQDYVKSQNVLLYILKIDPQYEEAQRLEDSIQREIQRREQYQMPALQKDLKKSIPQENFFTPEFSPKKASEAKGTESFSSPETPLPAFKEESFPPHPQEGAEEEKGEKESETFSPTPEGEKEEAQIEGEEQSSLSKEEELFSALEEGVNSQENQVSTISEEEKKSIESNNAEALENYEKLLNYARSTSKTPSPPPSSSSAKALEVQKVKDQLAEKKKRLETAQKEAQRQKERGEFTEEQYQRVLKLLAQKYAKDSAELQAEIARLEAQ